MHTPRDLLLVRTFAVNSSEELSRYAGLATVATAPEWYWHAAQLIGATPPSGQPFETHLYSPESGFGYSVWHHGNDVIASFYGQADRLIEHASLTENEREAILLETRRNTNENQVLGVAHRTLTGAKHYTLDAILQGSRLKFDGSIVTRFTH